MKNVKKLKCLIKPKLWYIARKDNILEIIEFLFKITYALAFNTYYAFLILTMLVLSSLKGDHRPLFVGCRTAIENNALVKEVPRAQRCWPQSTSLRHILFKCFYRFSRNKTFCYHQPCSCMCEVDPGWMVEGKATKEVEPRLPRLPNGWLSCQSNQSSLYVI